MSNNATAEKSGSSEHRYNLIHGWRLLGIGAFRSRSLAGSIIPVWRQHLGPPSSRPVAFSQADRERPAAFVVLIAHRAFITFPPPPSPPPPPPNPPPTILTPPQTHT